MKVRSPVLGYNHNVRYADRLWHVQTEDSGVNNPHVFTHLFHDGTILATKRLDYDPASEVIAVQKLMQAQHKAMLRELKAGAFDEKISKFLGVPLKKEAVPAPVPAESTDKFAKETEAALSEPPPATQPQQPEASLVQAAADLAEPRPLTGPAEPFDEPPTDRTQLPQLDTDRNLGEVVAAKKAADTDRKLTVPPPSQPRLTPLNPKSPAARPPLPPLRPPVRPATGRANPVQPAATRQPSGIGGRRPTGGAVVGGAKPSAEGVVVARPAVIVGGNSSAPARPPSQTSRVQPGRSSGRWHPTVNNPASTPAPPTHEDKGDNIFGGDLISEKSLDEVILAYLSEDLNDK
jgi:hypothetical protein